MKRHWPQKDSDPPPAPTAPGAGGALATGPEGDDPEPGSPVKGVSRNVFVLGITSLLTDLSSEVIYPLVPLFLTSVLGAPLSIVGLIEGIAESTASILKVVSGWLSDRMHRRRTLTVAGYGISALAKPLMAAAFSWPLVLLLRFADRFGKGVRTAPRDALITDSSRTAQRGRAFGFHRAMDTAGATLGSLLALLALALVGERYRIIFLLSAVPAALGVACLFLIRERKHGAVTTHDGGLHPTAVLSRRFKFFLLASVIFAVGNSSDAFLILRARDLGLSALAAVAAYVVFNLVYAALSMSAGTLSDRIGRKKIIAAGFLVFSLVYLGLAVASGTALVWPLFALYGLYMAMTEGITKAFTADMAPPQKRGTTLGTYYTITGVVAFPSSLLAGILWDAFGAPAPFYVGAAAALLAMVVFLTGVSEQPPSGEAA
jgi:MFS family permease